MKNPCLDLLLAALSFILILSLVGTLALLVLTFSNLWHLRNLSFVFCGSLFLVPSLEASTVETITPKVTVRQEYDDNLDLDPDNEISDWITTVLPGILFNTETEAMNLDLDYEGGWSFYRDNPSRDDTQHRGRLTWDHRLQRNLDFHLTDTFRKTEDPLVEEDDRVVDVQQERETEYRNDGEASLSYQFGTEDKIGAGYGNQYIDDRGIQNDDRIIHQGFLNLDKWFGEQNGVAWTAGYNIGNFEVRDDYRQIRTGITGLHRWNLSRIGYVRYSLLDHDYDEEPFLTLRNDYHIHEGTLGATVGLSAFTEMHLEAGYYYQDYQNGIGENQDGVIFNGSISTRAERSTWRLEASGGYDEDYFSSDNFGSSKYAEGLGRVDYQLTETWNVFASMRYRWDDYYEVGVKDDTWRSTGGLSYKLGRRITLSTQWTYYERDSDGITRDFTNNRIEFRVTGAYPQEL